MTAATYKTDPAWQAAQARYIAPSTGNPERDLLAGLAAAHELYRIECQYAGIDPDPAPAVEVSASA